MTTTQETVSHEQEKEETKKQIWWLDCKWIETIVTDDQRRRLGKVKSELATAPGDNYLSDVLRLKLEIFGDSPVKRGLVLKRTLNVSPFLLPISRIAFATEAKFYNKIVPKLEEVTRGTVLRGLELWPRCYHASSDAILLEDLKESGFTAAERIDGNLKEEVWKLAAYSLGQLHALSLATPGVGVLARTEPPFINAKKSLFLLNGIGHLADDIETHWGPKWADVGKRVRATVSYIGERLNKLASEETQFKVICHGDPWPNNFLIRPATKSRQASLKFVDFQLVHYSSYGWDIAYFMGTSGVSWSDLSRVCTEYARGFLDTKSILGMKNATLGNSKSEVKKSVQMENTLPRERRTSTPVTKLGGILSAKNRRTSAPASKLVTWATALKEEDLLDETLDDKSPLTVKAKEVETEVRRLGLFTFASAAVVAPATIARPEKPVTLDMILRDPKAGAQLHSCVVYRAFIRSLLTDLIRDNII